MNIAKYSNHQMFKSGLGCKSKYTENLKWFLASSGAWVPSNFTHWQLLILTIPNHHQSSCFCHRSTEKKFRLQHRRLKSISCLWYWFTASSIGNFLEINLRKKSFKLKGEHSLYNAWYTKEWKNSSHPLLVQCKWKNLRRNLSFTAITP